MKRSTWDPEQYEAHHSFVWELGQDLIELLDPQPGERILDLGCGTGQLTYKVAESGANAIGLDASPEMVGQARQNFPQLQFILQDAARMDFDSEFDAVFSNAALHWMLEASAVAKAVARALRKEGRFVGELGGKGNIRTIESAIEAVAEQYHTSTVPSGRTFYPSLGEYAALLESCGLEVRFATLFDRPTSLDGEAGMENWIRQFKWFYFENLPPAAAKRALEETVKTLRPLLFRDGKWIADYRRLRFIAVKR